MRGRLILRIAFVVISAVGVNAGTQDRFWQNGTLLFRKTVPTGRSFLQNRFVYRVHGFNRWYVVVSDIPLKLDLYVPMKFATDRNQIFIQDSDGKERKARILRTEYPTHRR